MGESVEHIGKDSSANPSQARLKYLQGLFDGIEIRAVWQPGIGESEVAPM